MRNPSSFICASSVRLNVTGARPGTAESPDGSCAPVASFIQRTSSDAMNFSLRVALPGCTMQAFGWPPSIRTAANKNEIIVMVSDSLFCGLDFAESAC
jgi:hypothetical protein